MGHRLAQMHTDYFSQKMYWAGIANMKIFNAKAQRSKDAETFRENFAPFAPLPLCVKLF
jgi:hypothetical protein